MPVLFVTCLNVRLDEERGFDVIGLLISRDHVELDERKSPTGLKGVRRPTYSETLRHDNEYRHGELHSFYSLVLCCTVHTRYSGS